MAHHILLQGGLGSGKTFGMVLLAWYIKLMTLKQGTDIQLFSNFDVKDSILVDNHERWYDIARAQGSICLWDEAHITFNNRGWAKHSATVITDLMMYTRKMQSLQMYATPSVNNVDQRIRQIIEIVVTMRKEGKKGFRFYFQDYQTGEHLRTVFIPMFKAKQVFELNLYDTHQMVRRFPIPKTEKESDKFFDKLEEIHDENRGFKREKKDNVVQLDERFAWLNEKEGE